MEAAERKELETRESLRGRPSDVLKKQVDQIAQHAIDVLKGTTCFFKETLSNQVRGERHPVLYSSTWTHQRNTTRYNGQLARCDEFDVK